MIEIDEVYAVFAYHTENDLLFIYSLRLNNESYRRFKYNAESTLNNNKSNF